MRDPLAAIGIIIVDPHPIFRFGLQRALDAVGVRVISSVGTGRDALSALQSGGADAAVLDLELPDMRGTKLLRTMAADYPETPAIVLTAEQDGGAIYQALASGAAGYLTKDVEPATVRDALHAALVGEIVISPALHRLIAAEIRLHASAEELDLTPREREVLGLVAEGCSSPEIGRRLFVSHTTVRTHLANAYEKLGVSDRAAAVAQAMRKGLLDPT